MLGPALCRAFFLGMSGMVGRGRENHGLLNFRALRCLPQLAWLDLRWQLARRQSRLKGWSYSHTGARGRPLDQVEPRESPQGMLAV